MLLTTQTNSKLFKISLLAAAVPRKCYEQNQKQTSAFIKEGIIQTLYLPFTAEEQNLSLETCV